MNKRFGMGYADYKTLLDRFGALLRRRLGDRLISLVLYGSVARGTARPESDVDLLIVLREASPVYYERLQPVLGAIQRLRREPVWISLRERGVEPCLSALVLSMQEASENRYIFLDMVAEARVLIDREDFFKTRLKAVGERLRQLGAKRVRLNGHWYWDLKPDLQPGEALTL